MYRRYKFDSVVVYCLRVKGIINDRWMMVMNRRRFLVPDSWGLIITGEY